MLKYVVTSAKGVSRVLVIVTRRGNPFSLTTQQICEKEEK